MNQDPKSITADQQRRRLLAAGGLVGASLALPGALRQALAQAPITVGIIYVGPRDDFGYNQAHAEAAALLKKMPGVKAVVAIVKEGATLRYQGDDIAAVAAETEEQARDAIRSSAAVGPSLAAAKQRLLEAGFLRIDYIALVDSVTLEPLDRPAGEMRLIAAATIGTTRLIDNLPVLAKDG